ncbi:hypothetical protein VNO77_34249 [Canavalia gladiata]|uniref:Uncharacterized protein n=1 Tax=Canavalia gladiata TaxID=3824 RepID=A0AAN9KGE0_CANGL
MSCILAHSFVQSKVFVSRMNNFTSLAKGWIGKGHTSKVHPQLFSGAAQLVALISSSIVCIFLARHVVDTHCRYESDYIKHIMSMLWPSSTMHVRLTAMVITKRASRTKFHAAKPVFANVTQSLDQCLALETTPGFNARMVVREDTFSVMIPLRYGLKQRCSFIESLFH